MARYRKGHVRQQSNGTWYFKIDMGKSVDGKRRQTTRRGFLTKSEAIAAMEEFQSDPPFPRVDYKASWKELEGALTEIISTLSGDVDSLITRHEINTLTLIQKMMGDIQHRNAVHIRNQLGEEDDHDSQ